MPAPSFSSKHSPARRLLALIPALAGMTAVGLVACGGGGSDSGAGSAAAVKLDATNYKAASGTVVDAGFGLADLDPNAIAGSNNKPSAMRAALKTFDSLRRAAGKSVKSGESGKSGAVGATTDGTSNCSGGGTIRIETSIARPSASSAGDRVAITYDNCIDLLARTETDGKLEFVLTYAGLGDWFSDPAYDVRVTYTATQLRTIDRSGTSVVDGSFELESVRSAVRTGHDSFAAPRLESSFTPLTGARSWSTVSGFLARNDYTTSTTTTTLDGTVAGSDGLNQGSVIVDTTTPFVRAIGHYPNVGVLTATGDQGTKVEVRAIDDTTVRLSLDSNGDGAWDAVEDVAWVSIW